MDLLSVLLIAVALSMDSFAVSISNGLTIKDLNPKRVLTISLSLAFFQAAMPLIGWLAGLGIEELIKDVDHWVAFTLLCLIGAKMIIEGIRKKVSESDAELKIMTLLAQSLATSIDAFAVGISFALLNQSIVLPFLIIGLVTFGFSLLGLYLGKFFGKRLGKAVEIFGGLVLIGIGLKILIEHQFLII